MKLVHFSDQIVTAVHNDFRQTGHNKPHGFWVSVEGEIDGEESYGWRQWCEDEGFGLNRLTHAHEVTLTPDAHILRIRTGVDLNTFDDQWREQPDWSDPIQRKYHPRLSSTIDWSRVAKRWQGIIIAPYLWSHRLEGPFWYYGWDCASGCIWDPSAIASIKLELPAPADAQ